MSDKPLEQQIASAIASIIAATDRKVSYRVSTSEDQTFGRKRKDRGRIEIVINIEEGITQN